MVPLPIGGAGARHPAAERHGTRARVQRLRRPAAGNACRQHGCRAGECATVRRDAAAAEGNRAAQRRARGHQQRSSRAWREARLPGHRRPRRRQAARGVRAPATSASAGIDEASSDRLHFLYEYEHGVRMRHPPRPSQNADAPVTQLVCRRASRSWPTRRPRWKHCGSITIPGTDPSLASVFVPILGGDRVLGFDRPGGLRARDTPSAKPTCGCFTTVAASMGVALENARLFDETQRRTHETAGAGRGRPRDQLDARPRDRDRPDRAPREGPAGRGQQRDLPAAADGNSYRAIVAIGETAEQLRATRSGPAKASSAACSKGVPSSSTTRRTTRAASRSRERCRSRRSVCWSRRCWPASRSRA